MKKKIYQTPSVEVITVNIEKGFAESEYGTMGDGPMTETSGEWA